MSADETELRVAWQIAAGSSRPAMALFASLVARHREPHRRYHGLRHVTWVVRHIGALAEHEPVKDRSAVVIAGFFHDAVYQPTASDNEAASAELAIHELGRLDSPAWPTFRIDHVAAMVLATRHDLPAADEIVDTTPGNDTAAGIAVDAVTDAATGIGIEMETDVLLDADLAVLGADAAAYLAYVNGVRAEYGHVDPTAWRQGRRAVLEQFVARPSIYRTPTARGWWEARARANLAAELATLG